MTSKVLDGGPSDHNPFVQSFRYSVGPGGFTAVTYNVNHSNGIDKLAKTFVEILLQRPDVWILQEVVRRNRRGIKNWLRRHGYKVKVADPEFAIAFDKKKFEYVRHWRPLMSPTEYWTLNYALVVVLRDKVTGQMVKFMSYHPPAHVQAPKHKTFPVVSKVLREVVSKWNQIARRNSKHISACCFAGDDNVDEFKGWAPADEWEFMLNGPLRQVRAPEATHGNNQEGRRIDDFRINNGLRTA